MLVIDASVIVKLLKPEDDSDHALALIDHIAAERVASTIPSLALYETLSAALHVGLPFTGVAQLFDTLREFGIALTQPTSGELALAGDIATSVSPIGGYPHLYDAIYHAMAVARNGVLVTADIKHLRKTEHLGHVIALQKWRP